VVKKSFVLLSQLVFEKKKKRKTTKVKINMQKNFGLCFSQTKNGEGKRFVIPACF
jgi:hypothetical protein